MLFLRPQKHEPMMTSRVMKIAVYFGTLASVIFGIPLILYYEQCGCRPMFYSDSMPLNFLGFTLFMQFTMLVMYQFIFATAWNNRASRLQKQKRKHEDIMDEVS